MVSTLSEEKLTISRKEHYCSGCYTKWPAGTAFITSSYADGGSAFTWRECPICQEIRKQPDFDLGDPWEGYAIEEGGFQEYHRFNEIKAKHNK